MSMEVPRSEYLLYVLQTLQNRAAHLVTKSKSKSTMLHQVGSKLPEMHFTTNLFLAAKAGL